MQLIAAFDLPIECSGEGTRNLHVFFCLTVLLLSANPCSVSLLHSTKNAWKQRATGRFYAILLLSASLCPCLLHNLQTSGCAAPLGLALEDVAELCLQAL